MSFGWINLAGGIVVVLMLLPNILFALKYRHAENRCRNLFMNILEQVGRYASMLFMVVGFSEFGFSSVERMLLYLLGNGILMLGYWIIWGLFFRKPRFWHRMALAGLPVGIFLLSGLTLMNLPLILSGAIFGIGHIYITAKNS